EHNYTDEAEQTYRLAMQMEPDNREAVYNLANLLGKTGRLDEARLLLQDFQQAHPGQSGMPEASISLGAGPTN
ncbi:MAG TPA: tetratricopeptide repeat protein, partial [Patescibacteria group bacterium]|nr:tetratricopeptide repeat protein [Patescibacteria group bacterium]